jgi:procollagen-lysine,2-oxoglutarate 5-dioxygenase 1
LSVWLPNFVFREDFSSEDAENMDDEISEMAMLEIFQDTYPPAPSDMAMCYSMRENDVFMHVTNRVSFGHLINADDFNTSHLHNELWELMNNRHDWEKRYMHDNYSRNLEVGVMDCS